MRRRDFIKAIVRSAAVWPLAARAQQSAMPVIGFLSAASAAATPQKATALREGLADAGFVEGKNVAIEFRFADQHLERLPKLAIDLVRRQVAVIVTGGGDVPAMIAKGATSPIPIVFVTGFDPVKSGLVASLNRPGRNVTGATVIAGQLSEKRLELLRDLVPTARHIAVLINQDNPNAETDAPDLEAAARTLGIQIEFLKASDEREVDSAFVSLAQLKAEALLLDPDPLFTTLRQKIVALAEHQSVPGLLFKRLHCCRRPDLVWSELRRCVSTGWHLCWPHHQGRKTGRPASRAASKVRVGDQSQIRQGARSHYSGRCARARRRGDRIRSNVRY
jgi:putative tryptophan/tyrosine transport system substrate-binding protein